MTAAMPDNQAESLILPGVGLGILSWKGYDSLTSMLTGLKQSGFLDLFEERMIHFPQLEAEGQAIAKKFGFDHSGTAENQGIYRGFRGLAESMNSETILLLENDLHLLEPFDEAVRQMQHAVDLVQHDKLDLCLLRHTGDPGQSFNGAQKYQAYYPGQDAKPVDKLFAWLRRTCRPIKAKRVIGNAPYVERDPDIKFAEISRDSESGFLLMDSSIRTWTNQSVVIQRSFFVDTLMERVGNTESRRRVNGFKNIEIELNCSWWRQQKFQIGIGSGLFSHKRTGNRGY